MTNRVAATAALRIRCPSRQRQRRTIGALQRPRDDISERLTFRPVMADLPRCVCSQTIGEQACGNAEAGVASSADHESTPCPRVAEGYDLQTQRFLKRGRAFTWHDGDSKIGRHNAARCVNG